LGRSSLSTQNFALVGDQDGTCRLFNPVFTTSLWLLTEPSSSAVNGYFEDEGERVQDQLLAEEVL